MERPIEVTRVSLGSSRRGCEYDLVSYWEIWRLPEVGAKCGGLDVVVFDVVGSPAMGTDELMGLMATVKLLPIQDVKVNECMCPNAKRILEYIKQTIQKFGQYFGVGLTTTPIIWDVDLNQKHFKAEFRFEKLDISRLSRAGVLQYLKVFEGAKAHKRVMDYAIIPSQLAKFREVEAGVLLPSKIKNPVEFITDKKAFERYLPILWWYLKNPDIVKRDGGRTVKLYRFKIPAEKFCSYLEQNPYLAKFVLDLYPAF
jgi:hypothetical protein